MAAKFEIKQAKNGEFHFNLKAANGQVVLSSEAYPTLAGAKKGIESVRKNSAKPASFERRTSTGGQPYFVVKAGNGEVVGRSQMYASADSVRSGIASVQRSAPAAAVVEVKDAA